MSDGTLRSRLLSLLPFMAALMGAVAVVTAFYPGYMSADSLDQLHQARSGVFSAWHPPIMAWLWSKLDPLLPGPGGMLLLQNALFWAGIALVVAQALPRPAAAPIVLLIGWWPPLFANLGTIWKDVHLTSAMVLSTGLLMMAERRRRASALVPAALLLFYAVAVRHNGIAAALPFIFWWGRTLRGAVFPEQSPRMALLAAGALTAMIMGGSSLLTSRLCAERSLPPLQTPLVHDLVGISTATRQDLVPPWVHAGPGAPPMERLAAIYRPETSDPLYYEPGHLPITRDPAEVAELRRRWLQAIARYPGIYLHQRLQMFQTLVGFGIREVWYPYHTGIDKNDLGVAVRRSRLNLSVTDYLARVRDSVLFRAWGYLAAMGLVAALAVAARRATSATVALVASALAYLGSFFFLSPAPDFRYALWPVAASLLLPFTLHTRLGRSAAAHRAALPPQAEARARQPAPLSSGPPADIR